MDILDFFDKDQRKINKLQIPESLNIFKKNKIDSWDIHNIDQIKIKGYKNQNIDFEMALEDFLTETLPYNIELINDLIIDHYDNYNSFHQDLPIFIIRRHGSRAGEKGSRMRRRGWLVRFNNAWIVYADNFLSRHFFEAGYFVTEYSKGSLKNNICNFKMPISSGGGSFEKKHRLFPQLSHLTSTSGLYLSHILDLNQNNYKIDNLIFNAKTILGSGELSRFGCGQISDWDDGISVHDNKNYRVINSDLSEIDLKFLKAYNIRMLSPFNYFPFPKAKLILSDSISGESEIVRSYVNSYYLKNFKDNYPTFLKLACSDFY